MSILTNKMLSARTDHYGNSCKLWFPCDDTGNSIVSRGGVVTIPDTATAEHNEPHAISLISTATLAGTGIANIQIPEIGIAMAVFKAHAIPAVSSITLGGISAENGILLGCLSNSLQVGAVVEANAPVTAVSGSDYVIHAIAWDTANAYCYFDAAATIAGLSVTLEASSAINASLPPLLPANFTDKVTISNVSPIDLFGIVLFGFNTALPSDVLTGVRTMAANWLKGEKTLYQPWASL